MRKKPLCVGALTSENAAKALFLVIDCQTEFARRTAAGIPLSQPNAEDAICKHRRVALC